MRNSLDSGANQTGIQSLLQVHFLHGLHGLPLSELHLDISDVLGRVGAELFVGSLLLLGLIFDSWKQFRQNFF